MQIARFEMQIVRSLAPLHRVIVIWCSAMLVATTTLAGLVAALTTSARPPVSRSFVSTYGVTCCKNTINREWNAARAAACSPTARSAEATALTTSRS